jgi:hypothetical protein
MLLYKESISIWALNNSHISGCYELLFTCVCFLFEQYGFWSSNIGVFILGVWVHSSLQA